MQHRNLPMVMCAVVLLTVGGGPRLFAEEAPAQSGAQDLRQLSCPEVIAKSSSGQTLTPSEGDALVKCYFPEDLSDGVIGDGFQAHQPPPDLYDLQRFDNLPGVLGSGMVNG